MRGLEKRLSKESLFLISPIRDPGLDKGEDRWDMFSQGKTPTNEKAWRFER